MMNNDKQLDQRISKWLEGEAPRQLPDRVLSATFERTRNMTQRHGWRAALSGIRLTRLTFEVAGAVAVLVVATIALGVYFTRPGIGSDPRAPFAGEWESTSDADGGRQTLIVGRVANNGVSIVVTDTIASVCNGGPSTMTGTGSVDGNQMVIPAPDFRCDDGSAPQLIDNSGGQISHVLKDLTYTRDPQTDTLSVTGHDLWVRVGTAAPSPATPQPVADGSWWPQANLDEVRVAQERADAGNPDYTWQVDPGLAGQVGQHHPGDSRIFGRFLREKLGWENFLWAEDAAHPDGLAAGDVVYLRCAPGTTNSLYPYEEHGCQPTIDGTHFETVKITVAQPDRQGDSGVWVVTGWQEIDPFVQTVPFSDSQINTFMDAFFQARIAGRGAEQLAAFPTETRFGTDLVDREIPLLYATSSGATYERGEFDVVAGPTWPNGWTEFRVRMFAQGGATTVEQLFSTDSNSSGRLGLVYEAQGIGTVENGTPIAKRYSFLDGAVTYSAAYPLQPTVDGFRASDRLALEGVLPGDDNPRRVLIMLSDPRTIGPDCAESSIPADAQALAASIRGDSDFNTSAPTAVNIGGLSALQLDVRLVPSAASCPWSVAAFDSEISSSGPVLFAGAPFFAGQDRARVYLVDLPGGQVLALVTMTDADSYATVLGYVNPVVESLQFHGL